MVKKMLDAHPELRTIVDRIKAQNEKRSEDLARLGHMEGLTAPSTTREAPDVRSQDQEGNSLPVQEALQGS
jgi:hypothetical protein